MHELDVAPRVGARRDRHRAGAGERRVVLRQLDAECLRQLARPRAELHSGVEAAPRTHRLDAVEWLERADQHGGTDALRLADRVQQRVDAVGAVHIGTAGRAEQRPRPQRETGERVAGRLAVVISLRLDDHAARAGVRDDAADEVARDLEDRPVVEAGGQRRERRRTGRAGGGERSGRRGHAE